MNTNTLKTIALATVAGITIGSASVGFAEDRAGAGIGGGAGGAGTDIVVNGGTITSAGGGVGEVTTTDLAKKVSKSGDTMTGALKFSFYENNIGTDSSNKFIRVNSASVYQDGANIAMFGKDWSESNYKGCFNVEARDGTNKSNLKGTPSGNLTWNGNDISGNISTFTITPVSGITIGDVSAYKIGKIVIVAFRAHADKTFSGQAIIFTGFPGPNMTTPVPFTYYNSSTGHRGWLGTDGKVRADTEGIHNDYFNVNFVYVAK